MTVEVGSAAPDFALKDQHGEVVTLSSFRGRTNVVLVFYPFAFSGICTGELCEIRDNLSVFDDGDVQVAGISCDPMHTLRAFARAEKYDFPLLSDFWPHGEVARAYGVLNEATGAPRRGSFLVDREGVLRWALVHGPGEARPLAAYRAAIAALAA
jgi:peroxiredoxin